MGYGPSPALAEPRAGAGRGGRVPAAGAGMAERDRGRAWRGVWTAADESTSRAVAGQAELSDAGRTVRRTTRGWRDAGRATATGLPGEWARGGTSGRSVTNRSWGPSEGLTASPTTEFHHLADHRRDLAKSGRLTPCEERPVEGAPRGYPARRQPGGTRPVAPGLDEAGSDRQRRRRREAVARKAARCPRAPGLAADRKAGQGGNTAGRMQAARSPKYSARVCTTNMTTGLVGSAA